ncbi:MAG: RsmD family RNA methyltransferase [Deltaproteobacteria bacterium]|nr:RsmD family RNA methyltransferase [Deltaproteobacteria bacterium]
MRFSGGSLKGRRLPGAVTRGVRPTPARVREAMFDILGQDLSGWTVLDATGGSGILAIEAAGRGADLVVILDRSPRAVRAIEKAVLALSLAGRVQVRRADALRDPLPDRCFDLVVADPPYGSPLEPWLDRLRPLARAWFVLEHAARQAAPGQADSGVRTRRYGDTALTFYPGTPSASSRIRTGGGGAG